MSDLNKLKQFIQEEVKKVFKTQLNEEEMGGLNMSGWKTDENGKIYINKEFGDDMIVVDTLDRNDYDNEEAFQRAVSEKVLNIEKRSGRSRVYARPYKMG